MLRIGLFGGTRRESGELRKIYRLWAEGLIYLLLWRGLLEGKAIIDDSYFRNIAALLRGKTTVLQSTRQNVIILERHKLSIDISIA